MLSWLRRGPRFVDREFADLARMLTDDLKHPVYKRELLDDAQLDMSLESLRHVDAYLEAVHDAPPEDETLISVVLRCGAYAGEVMRKHTAADVHWITYDEAAKHSPFVASFERSLGTAGILWESSDSMCFPLGKICKFIENGNADSVYFFARVFLDKFENPSGD